MNLDELGKYFSAKTLRIKDEQLARAFFEHKCIQLEFGLYIIAIAQACANCNLVVAVFFVHKDYIRLLQLLIWFPFLLTFVLLKRRWSGLKFYLPLLAILKVIGYVLINRRMLEEARCKNDVTHLEFL